LLSIKNLYLVITDCAVNRINKLKRTNVNPLETFLKIENQVLDVFQIKIDSFKIDLLYDDSDEEDKKKCTLL